MDSTPDKYVHLLGDRDVNELVFKTCTGGSSTVVATLDALGVAAGSVGESAALLARMEYTVDEIRDALAKRFGLSRDLAAAIATEAVTRSTMVNTDEPQDSGGPHGTT